VILACPSCGARFNLDPAKLLPAGRNVRCAKCDHRWKQMPEGFEEPPEPAEQAETPAPPAEPVAEPAAEPAPESFAPPPPEEPESHLPSPPETPAEMAESLAAIAEQVAGARMGPTGGEGYTVSEAPPQAGPNPIARLARRTAPGPITVPPRMRPMRPAKRSSNFGLILLAGCIIGLLIAAYVFRNVIARTVPGTDVIYSLLNLSTDNAAVDLEISDFSIVAQKDEKTGKQVLQVQGTIFNLAEYPLNVPPLMLTAVGPSGSDLEPIKFRLNEQMLEPGENVKFQITFQDWPSSTAQSYGLGWADTE
jgi:predicted Zn finger-like uncharacterized protein